MNQNMNNQGDWVEFSNCSSRHEQAGLVPTLPGELSPDRLKELALLGEGSVTWKHLPVLITEGPPHHLTRADVYQVMRRWKETIFS